MILSFATRIHHNGFILAISGLMYYPQPFCMELLRNFLRTASLNRAGLIDMGKES